jgi:molybdopterin molybdotransferase
MISIQQAFAILDAVPVNLHEIDLPLFAARNHVLAETVISRIDMPPFRQATMDGYALALHDSLTYEIVGEIKAGDGNGVELQPGEAARIYTGAAVPDSAEAVMQIEKVSMDGNQLKLHENIAAGMNVRPKGAQIKTGDVALEKGTLLNAAAIGFLAGLGFAKVSVFGKPKVAVVVTGNELTKIGEPLPIGKIYESNAVMLQSALYGSGFDAVTVYQVQDNFEQTKSTLRTAIEANDVVLVSGGISVGDYDFVGKALENLGVNQLFYKVNQKPGKPLLAGNLNQKMIFALPGNPAASLTCFYVYVRPMLQRLSGIPYAFGNTVQKFLSHDYEVANARDLILKAKISGNEVEILPHQDSAMLDSFAVANALVYLPNGNYELAQGSPVKVFLL